MESDEQILQVVNVIFSNGIGIPPDTINECQEMARQFQESIDSFHWSLSYLPTSTNSKLSLFAIIIIREWVLNHWDAVAESASQLYEVLFLNYQRYMGYQRVFKYPLYIVQTYLITKIYPEHVPEFFQQLLTFSPDFIIPFLEVFFNTLKYNQETQEQILISMSADGSNQALLHFILEGISANRTDCIGLLVDILTWVDPMDVLDSPAINKIFEQAVQSSDEQGEQLLIQKTIKIQTNEDGEEEEIEDGYSATLSVLLNKKWENALKVIDGLLGSPIDPEQLFSFLQEREILTWLKSILEQSSNETVLSLVGSIISDFGNRLLKSTAAVNEECIEMALDLIDSENEVIAESVLPFLKLCALNTEDARFQGDILEHLFQRYALYFAQEPLELNDFSEDVLKTILKIQQANPPLFEELLSSACSEGESGRLDVIAAICHIMMNIRSNAHTKDIVEMFGGLLESTPVPCERLQYLALTQFIEYTVKKYKEEPPQMQFEVVVQHAVCPDSPEEYAQTFVSLLNSMLRLNIVVSEEVPPELVQTGNRKYIGLAAKMIKKIPSVEQQMQCVEQCIEQLDSVEGFLEFVESLPPAKSKADVELANSIMQKYIETIVSEEAPDAVFARSISAMYDLLGDNCFEHFIAVTQCSLQMESLAQVCRIGNFLIDKRPDGEWITPLFTHVTEALLGVIPEIGDWFDNSEETRLAKDFIAQYFKFAKTGFRFAESPSVPLSVAQMLCANELHVLDVCKNALTFITLLKDEEFQACLETAELFDIVRSTMMCVVTEGFNPNDASWRVLLRQSMKIQGRMVQMMGGDQLQSTVESWLSEAGCTDVGTIIAEWIELMGNGVSQTDASVGAFMSDYFQSVQQ